MRYEQISRIAGLLSAAAVAAVTFAVTAHAVQSLTIANEFTMAYTLDVDGSSVPITTVANLPVLVMGDQTFTEDVGSSDMTVVNSAGRDNELVWSGLEWSGKRWGRCYCGLQPDRGHHIMYIDFAHCVELQVNDATSFRVHNNCPFAAAGRVTEIW